MANIFKSNFTLKFKSPYIEKGYQAMRNKTLRKYNIIYSIINVILSIMHCLIYSLTYQEVKTRLYDFIKYTTYTLSGINVVWLILSLAFKNFNFQKWIAYINLLTISIILWGFRIYAGNTAKLDTVITTLILFVHLTYLMAWFFTNSLDFYDGFWMYLTMSCIGWGYYSSLHPLSMQFRFFIVSLTVMLGSFVSYFYMKEKKTSFYLDFMNDSTIKSYVSIIQNMNSGFISVKNSEIISLNKTIYNHLKKIDRSLEDNNNIINENAMIKEDDCTNTDFTSYSPEKAKALLNELFNGIVIESFNRTGVDQTDYERTLEYIKNYNYENAIHKENFIFIGNKTYNAKDKTQSQYYEVFGRYCDLFKEEQENNYEFMFNDVSKTKISEEINADFKYKSIFLSKVAHEFKNPLLCVSELIDQVNENLDQISIESTNKSISKKSKVKDTLNQIKSMCEYLLILVKDLDFFSLKSTGATNKIKLEKQNVKLDRIVGYCNNITNVLLKKFNKEESIKFNIDCIQELYEREIFSDEMRVKQILINLLSNSVKYTFHGRITLQITKENEDVVFSVIDTGNGLSEDQKMRLNTNSIDNREISAYSSGLGFSIIKELITLLDSQLYYESGDLGSKFTFHLGLVSNFLETSLISLNHKSQNSKSSLLSEPVTLVKTFYPFVDADIILKIKEGIKKNSPNDSLEVDKSEDQILFDSKPDTDYYLVVDDEQFTRKSTIRILNNYLVKKNINIRDWIILEACDGIECLYTFYRCMKKGIKLSFIISDQTMNFMNGDSCANVLNEIIKSNNMRHVPYFILTAYENFDYNKESINRSYTKPLTLISIVEIISLASKV